MGRNVRQRALPRFMHCEMWVVRGTKTGSTWPSPPPGSTAQSMEQRFTFNQVASVYRDARPDYPEALIDDVVSYAGLKPNDAILEVGCGTGQATKSFAAR